MATLNESWQGHLIILANFPVLEDGTHATGEAMLLPFNTVCCFVTTRVLFGSCLRCEQQSWYVESFLNPQQPQEIWQYVFVPLGLEVQCLLVSSWSTCDKPLLLTSRATPGAMCISKGCLWWPKSFSFIPPHSSGHAALGSQFSQNLFSNKILLEILISLRVKYHVSPLTGWFVCVN